MTIAQVVSEAGLGQLHVAETEKYPHVTYFFNGGEEEAYPGEVRELVPSPRDVPTYDHKPEMSAREATDAFVEHWAADEPAFAIINFANPDMVGHTGVIPAAVKAVETVDECLGRVVEAVARAAAPASSPPTTATATHMLERRRLAEHRALAEPGAVRGDPRGRRARRAGHPRRRGADGAAR